MKRSSRFKLLFSIGAGIACLTILFASCKGRDRKQSTGRSGELTVFNAGSLSAPVADLLKEFSRTNPGVIPQQESSGSLEAARKITELGKPCDVLLVADYEVIPSLLMPQYSDWYAIFARNQLVLIYTAKSKFSDQINNSNWYEVLLRPDVQVGHSNPDLDPAGYRTLLHWQLAETYYHAPGLYERLRSSVPAKNIRPKSVELIALLQSGELDYVYCYRSIAEHNDLPFINFPSEIDFSEPAKSDFYARAQTEVAGNKPGDRITIKGMPIQYGLTIPISAPNREAAEEFVKFLLSAQGREIMNRDHLMTVSPALAPDIDKVPIGLRSLVAPVGKK